MYSENEPDNDKYIEEERRFDKSAHELQNQIRGMLNKYQWLLMKESMVSERCFVWFIFDQMALEI